MSFWTYLCDLEEICLDLLSLVKIINKLIYLDLSPLVLVDLFTLSKWTYQYYFLDFLLNLVLSLI